ncbi:MAG: hypothetical protein M3283_02700 [Actinomycetota bacterium]|nr:hypothetical protein [Actinomycetota bacterium]
MTAEHVEADAAMALLRRFEPVMRFTRGERFYPMDVEPYVRSCSLWVQHAGEEAVCLVPRGELTLEDLAQQPQDEFGATRFLRFTDPQSFRELYSRRLRRKHVSEKRKEPDNIFRAGRGRLARVGYLSRVVDALYSLALLARGRLPGEASFASSIRYRHIMSEREQYRYHGRVLRQGGWIVLQYWFFYAFNDWRSGFYGANDHEGDWEKILVYLSESETGEVRPEWAAYAAHDYKGDDLRRRWDDPELEKVGEHLIVYVGAGTHASYYSQGEYLTELELRPPGPIARATDAFHSFWRKTLRQYAGDGTRLEQNGVTNLFLIPFVDYARGDGAVVGPGQEKEWEPPRLLDSPSSAWVSGYRGLWGFYAQDPFEGEDAPAGPMYNHDKSVRREWYDPVGWAGLDKVPTQTEALRTILEQRSNVATRCAVLRTEIEEKSDQLKRLGVEVAAMRGQSHLLASYEAKKMQLDELSQEVEQLRAQLVTDKTVSESLEGYAAHLQAGERGPARAHISRALHPVSDDGGRTGRVAELWAAVSVGLMLIALVWIVMFERQAIASALVASIALFALLEASFRGRLANLVSSVNIGLGMLAALIIAYEFFWQIVALAVLIVGIYVLWDNLRELRR